MPLQLAHSAVSFLSSPLIHLYCLSTPVAPRGCLPDGDDVAEVVKNLPRLHDRPSSRSGAGGPSGSIASPLAVALRTSSVSLGLGGFPSDNAVNRCAMFTMTPWSIVTYMTSRKVKKNTVPISQILNLSRRRFSPSSLVHSALSTFRPPPDSTLLSDICTILS